MKIRLLGMSLCLMLATAAFGQSRYDVPFAFQVGDQGFAAGHYSVSAASVGHGLLISQEGGNSVVVYPRYPIQTNTPAPSGRLVFECYGKTCFLSQVWHGGSTRGMRLGGSKLEREMAKNAIPAEAVVLQAVTRR